MDGCMDKNGGPSFLKKGGSSSPNWVRDTGSEAGQAAIKSARHTQPRPPVDSRGFVAHFSVLHRCMERASPTPFK